MKAWGFSILLGLFASAAGAKVFSFQNGNVAGYIRGGTQLLSLDQDAFVHSSGTQTEFPDSGVKYGFNGEIGFQFSMGPLALRLGAEAFHPKELEIIGSDSSGSQLFTLTSSVFVFSPMLTLEY